MKTMNNVEELLKLLKEEPLCSHTVDEIEEAFKAMRGQIKVFKVIASGRCMDCYGEILIGAEDYDEALKFWEEEIFRRDNRKEELDDGRFGSDRWYAKYGHKYWNEPEKKPLENISATKKGFLSDTIFCD